MKRILILFLNFIATAFAEQLKIDISAPSAILINADNGRVLFSKNANEPIFPASITKIATVLYALEKKGDNLDEIVTVSKEACRQIDPILKRKKGYTLPAYYIDSDAGGTSLLPGEKLTFRDLLYAVLVSSENDAANMVAEFIGKSIPRFMDELNIYLKELGCNNTHFMNPHGLHHPDHITTAADMAKITRKAMQNALFRKMVSTKKYTLAKTNKHEQRDLIQTNKLLKRGSFFYPYAIGIKTGHTSNAHYTLVAGAEKEGRTLIAVILGSETSEERFSEPRKLFDLAFAEKANIKELFAKEELFKVEVEGGDKILEASLLENFNLKLYPSEEIELKAVALWDSLSLPIKKGDKVGKIVVKSIEGDEISSAPIFANGNVKIGLWANLKKFCTKLF